MQAIPDINEFIHKFPRPYIKNLNIYSKQPDNNVIFSPAAKYFVSKCKGRQSFIWFASYKKRIMCILIFQNHKNITDPSNEFYELDIKFDNTLCYNNVLLYGYYLQKDNIKYFMIENVFNFNNYIKIIEDVKYNNSYESKLGLFSKILPHICQSDHFLICLPIISDNIDTMLQLSTDLKGLDFYGINVYSPDKYLGHYQFLNRNTNNGAIGKRTIKASFQITTCIDEDLYNLFYKGMNKETLEFYGLALIDTFETSKMMNGIFRNIRENQNLDFMEESDDEEEFEKTEKDRFVKLEKSVVMECRYSNKFKKWIPEKIGNTAIITKKDLHYLLGQI